MTRLADITADHQQLTIDAYLGLGDPEPNVDGVCPYAAQCETRRAALPTFRPGQKCHWRAWWDVANCPIYRERGRA